MNVDALVAEVGSTTTLVNAFDGLDGDSPRFVGQGLARTTVLEGDVTAGLRGAIVSLERFLGEKVSWGSMMATSSAAGGLRMTVHGLVYDMTARAAREAALGAGAIVKMITAGKMSEAEAQRLSRVNPSIILLAGGVDYGERDTAIHNAGVIASLGLPAPVVYAGNVAAREAVLDIFDGTGVRVITVDNVYPRIDTLDVEPARNAIQRVFEEHIVHAPGMEKIREMIDGSVIPTPGAVMNAAVRLYNAIGDLMVVDVGGATTDVHSVTEGSEDINKILVAPEPLAKRTVEGDLGVFVNAANVAERIGWDNLDAELGVDSQCLLQEMIAERHAIPRDDDEAALVERLTRECVVTAVERHAGRVRSLFGRGGRAEVAEGKDLTRVRWIIGTGGALTRLPGGPEILRSIPDKNALRGAGLRGLLLPESVDVLIDHEYIMAATGVLGMTHPVAALALLKDSLFDREEVDIDALRNQEPVASETSCHVT